jgi:hypothetical protein
MDLAGDHRCIKDLIERMKKTDIVFFQPIKDKNWCQSRSYYIAVHLDYRRESSSSKPIINLLEFNSLISLGFDVEVLEDFKVI